MPSKDLIEAQGTLRVLIQNLIDAQIALKDIGDAARSETLHRYFLSESLTRAEFRGELEGILHREGVRDVHETGTAGGAVIRAWTAVKAKLGGGDPALIEAASEGESSTIDAYTDALRKDLPLPIRQVLARQATHVLQSCEYVTAARAGAS
ncbi:MAG TPA: DUF2383 domain-containing protein [Terracidiphilus sp.]|jgi:uncharacterized protein (TIGR02284 family)